ncbi:hypothetical protein [Pseudomonas sp. W2-17]|uniref:hypothetical protein n=1 Tax=Pseudomonas sp. W2-17 TaxID=3058039 RepID=UPI0034E05D79
MNTSLAPMYTNEVTGDFLQSLDTPTFTSEQIAGFHEKAAAVIRKNEAYCLAHPPIGIYRLATEGSQTRNGGIVQETQSTITCTLENGEQVRVAHKGDCVRYPDGSTAHIITGAGHSNSHIALVGSRLCNGDDIINTPQPHVLFVARQGVPLADDFLPAAGSANAE